MNKSPYSLSYRITKNTQVEPVYFFCGVKITSRDLKVAFGLGVGLGGVGLEVVEEDSLSALLFSSF